MLGDIIGIIGDIFVIIAFFLLQTRRLKSGDFSYLLLNIVGSLGVLFSLIYHWNLPAFIIETAWIMISLWSMYGYLKKKRFKIFKARV